MPDRYLLSGVLFFLAAGALFGSFIGAEATEVGPYSLPALLIGLGDDEYAA